MNVLEALDALRTQGMSLLGAVRGMSKTQLSGFGIRGSTAGSWLKLSETYFGPTRRKKLQAASLSAAEGLSIDALLVIEKHTRKLHSGATIDEWELRLELCALRGTVDEIAQRAADRVRELNRSVVDAEKKAFGKRALKGGKNTDPAGLRTITVTLPERVMSSTLGTLRATAGSLRRDDAGLSYEQAMADAFLTHVRGRGTARSETLTPLVVVGLPEWAKLAGGEGDESIFALTDGTTITGAELIRSRMADHHFVGIYDPVAGPVNLYRSNRNANFKQRALLSAESILCSWPGCTTSADECQVHHLQAWKAAGNTNLDNLAMACPVHNGRNDDDPDKPPLHGRLERIDGDVAFRPPDGSAAQSNSHPVRDRSASALARNRAGP